MPNLTSQMEAVCRRFEELSIRLNQPETAADPAQFRRLMQEYHEAQPVVDAYHALTIAQDHLAQAKALLEGDEPLDADFKAMVQQELSEKSQDVAELENNLKILLLPKDVNDEKSVIKTVESPLSAENIRHQPFIGSGRNTVYFIKRSHHATYTRFNSCFIRQHIIIEHSLAAHIYGVIVAAGFACPI